MAWMLLVAGTLAAAELFLRLPLARTARGLLRVAGKVRRTLRSPQISDHWKEKVLLFYARQMFWASLGVFSLMLTALLPLALLAALGTGIGVDLAGRLMEPLGLLVSLAVACGYLLLRRRLQHG
jgi:hypothetical protein